MAHWIWIVANALVIVGTAVYIWLFHPHPFAVVRSGQFAAQAAILFFFININMYFIFLVIKKSPRRSVKVALAKGARLIMKWHVRFALAGTAFIAIHAIVMSAALGATVGFAHPKMASGIASIALLCVVLFAGWLRRRRASGFRRKFHLTSAFVFAGMFLTHIVM